MTAIPFQWLLRYWLGEHLNQILFNEEKYKNHCCGHHYPLAVDPAPREPARTVQNKPLGAGLEPCKAREKPLINERQRRAKLRFAKDHKDWTREAWGKVLFSGESHTWWSNGSTEPWGAGRGIKSAYSNVKDWWRRCQDSWKFWV